MSGRQRPGGSRRACGTACGKALGELVWQVGLGERAGMWAMAGLPKAVLHHPLQGVLPCGGSRAREKTVHDRGPRATL